MLPPRETGYHSQPSTSGSCDRYEGFDPVIVTQLVTYALCLVLIVSATVPWLWFWTSRTIDRDGVRSVLAWPVFVPAALLWMVSCAVMIASASVDGCSGLSPRSRQAYLTGAAWTGELGRFLILAIVLLPIHNALASNRMPRVLTISIQVFVGMIAILFIAWLIICASYYSWTGPEYEIQYLYSTLTACSAAYFTLYLIALAVVAVDSIRLAYSRHSTEEAYSTRTRWWILITFAGSLSSAFVTIIYSWGWDIGHLRLDSGGQSVFIVLTRLPAAIGVMALVFAVESIPRSRRAGLDNGDTHAVDSAEGAIGMDALAADEDPFKRANSTGSSAKI